MLLRAYCISVVMITLLSGCSHAPRTRQPRISSVDDDIAFAERLHRRPTVVVDAGHGGKDVGAQSKTTPKYQEKTLNLSTARMLESKLKRMGYQTIMTRGDDFFVPLDLRANFANSNQASVFVSVHYNAAASHKAEGVEVYYYESEIDKERTEKSKKLAEQVLEKIVAKTGVKSRGVKHANFAVIRETNMPAILVEGGFVTNESDLSKIKEPDHQNQIALSIAEGVKEFLTD